MVFSTSNALSRAEINSVSLISEILSLTEIAPVETSQGESVKYVLSDQGA